MAIEKNQTNIGQSTDRTENQDVTFTATLGAAMSCNEVINKTELDYYTKVSGCSVRNQKDNLFNYNSLSEI